jgi:hypothetical protein
MIIHPYHSAHNDLLFYSTAPQLRVQLLAAAAGDVMAAGQQARAVLKLKRNARWLLLLLLLLPFPLLLLLPFLLLLLLLLLLAGSDGDDGSSGGKLKGGVRLHVEEGA